MKSMKKLFAAILALTLVFGLSVSAQAAGTYTITINNAASGHTYEAYQIFTGTLGTDGILSDIQWGSGVDSAALLTALKADSKVAAIFASCTSAADVAKAMDGITDDSDEAKAIAQVVGTHLNATAAGTSTESSGQYTIAGLAAGYYLVKDRTQPDLDAYTRFILEVVADATVTPKSGTPTVTKKVLDTNDSVMNGLNGNNFLFATDSNDAVGDSADHDIGDVVPFFLAGTLPSNYADYTSYTYVFHDTMCAGLTFDPDSVVVSVDGAQIASGYTVVTSGLTDGCTFEVRFADLKDIEGVGAGSMITVEYTATLNSGAVLGSAGNPNTVSLQYSNNPNVGGSGDTGTTPEDTVIVFTYQVIINKVDKNNAALTGAAFTLEKYSSATTSWTPITVVTNNEGTTFTFSGLDDGIYRLTETTTPSGYNTIDPIYFTVTATHDILSDNPALTSLLANQSDVNGTILTSGIIATFASNLDNGGMSTNITNNKGATLPSTGGTGTTIFYIVGGLLMAGAVLLFVNKKKLSGHKN